MTKPRVSQAIYIGMIVFLLFPLAVLAFYSFNDNKGFNFTHLSFRWYQELFSGSRTSSSLWNAVGNSLLIALVSATVSTVIGTLGAIGLNWYGFFHKKYVQAVSFIPLVLPEIIIGISMLVFFSRILHVELSLATIMIAHISFTLPFVILMVQARLAEFDYSVIEAARDLGAKEKDVLLRVIIPMSMPGIAAGFVTAFTLSLEDYVVTKFVQGANSETLPLYVSKIIKKNVPMEVSAFSVLLIVATLVLVFSLRNLAKYLVKSK